MEEEEEEEIVNEPRITIGAQDIISLKTSSHSGFLRYEGLFEKFVRSSIILRPFFREAMKWRRRFVVLCEGCIYIYSDEFATSPSKAFSLDGFRGVKRIQGDEIDPRRKRMSFELEPLSELDKSMKFCAVSDEERKIWFQKIRKEIQYAAKITSDIKSDFDLDEYVHLEQPVQTVQRTIRPKKKPQKLPGRPGEKKPLPPTPGEKSDDSDSDSDYDKPSDDVFNNPPKALPGLASQDKSKSPPKNTRLVAAAKPKPPPKPAKTKSFSRSEFDYNSSDRIRAEEILRSLPVGTFLVRKSRSDDQEVLSVKTEEGVKEYKIYNKEKGYSIDNKDNWFSTTEELLNFYAGHDLPNRVLTLSRGYSSSDTQM